MKLRLRVLQDLERHGITMSPDDTPETLRERLNDLYLEHVRRLTERQRAGEIPLRDYARHVQALKDAFPLLGLPTSMWIESADN